MILKKLKEVGVSGPILKFFQNFLIGQTMRVLANGRISGVRDVVSGTPQGSGLSPLLFALFIFSLATTLEEHRDWGKGTEEEELKRRNGRRGENRPEQTWRRICSQTI